MNKSLFGRLALLSSFAAFGALTLIPVVACGQVETSSVKREVASATVVPLKGNLPKDWASTALRLEKMNFPAGSSSARIYVLAPGLQTGSVDSSGYVGSVSAGHARHLPQDFQLHLEADQIRALMVGNSNEKSKAVVLIEAVDRTGRAVPGAKAEFAVLVDGNQLGRAP